MANDGFSQRPHTDEKLFAYTLSSGVRDADRDIVLFRDQFAIRGIWSDGTTIWVADESQPRFFAYTLSSGIRDTDKEFLPHKPPNARYANNRNDTGIWSDGTSMWVADSDDDKLYAYKMPSPTAGGTTLRTLTLSAGTLRPAFNFMRTGYRAALANGVSQVTVTAVAQNSGSTAEFLDYYGDPLADADDTARGHQVDVHAGVTILNVVHIKVTASNGDALTYRVVLERDSDRFYGWTPTRDVNTLAAAGNLDVSGLWGDATTIWASDLVAGKLFAYNKADGARNAAGDISLDADNDQPSGIGSDGTTLWVGESGNVGTVNNHVYKLFAYTKATGVRDADKDITLDANNTNLGGLWANTTTIWVEDRLKDKLYAYKLSPAAEFGDRDFGKDITPHGNNTTLHGIWSDGTTMWVADFLAERTFAYALSDGARDREREFSLPGSPTGIAALWSDGVTMWVGNHVDDKLYSLTMPPATAGDNTLSALSVTHSTPAVALDLRPAFAFDHSSYRTAVGNAVTRVTVDPTLNDSGATLEFLDENSGTLPDAGSRATGHQVDVAVGVTTVKAKVTSGGNSLTYTLAVERDSNEDWGWTPTRDFNHLTAGNIYIRGMWGNETTLYVSHLVDPKIYAYNRADGSRASGKDITLDSENEHARGIWSDGTTLWVLDMTDEILYAYTLDTKVRDPGRDLNLDLPTREGAMDIWSDGTTVWVSDYLAKILYAYTLDTKARDPDRDIAADSENVLPTGIWSDGTTMWVAENNRRRVFAYALADGARDESNEFELAPDIGGPWALWSDGTSLFILHPGGKKIYSYNMPPPNLATLRWLELSDATLIPRFRGAITGYTAVVGSSVDQTTVTPTPASPEATYVITPSDADSGTPGHQVALSADGDTVIRVMVTAPDRMTTMTYTVTVTRSTGPHIVIAASKQVFDRKGGPDNGGYRERDLIIALYNLESDATWSGDNYSGDPSTLDYVHRTDILDADGSTTLEALDRRNDCEGPALFERNHIQMSVDREIRKVNENPETRGGGVIDTGDCVNDFAVTVTVWPGGAYESKGREDAGYLQLTCRFNADASDDFRAFPWDGTTHSGDGWYYHGYVLCTDADGDFAPDSVPTIPALNWEPPE